MRTFDSFLSLKLKGSIALFSFELATRKAAAHSLALVFLYELELDFLALDFFIQERLTFLFLVLASLLFAFLFVEAQCTDFRVPLFQGFVFPFVIGAKRRPGSHWRGRFLHDGRGRFRHDGRGRFLHDGRRRVYDGRGGGTRLRVARSFLFYCRASLASVQVHLGDRPRPDLLAPVALGVAFPPLGKVRDITIHWAWIRVAGLVLGQLFAGLAVERRGLRDGPRPGALPRAARLVTFAKFSPG